MFNLNETEVRAQEQEDREFVNSLNIMDYVSRFSLGNLHLLQDAVHSVDHLDNFLTGGSLLGGSHFDSKESIVDGADLNIIRTLVS